MTEPPSAEALFEEFISTDVTVRLPRPDATPDEWSRYAYLNLEAAKARLRIWQQLVSHSDVSSLPYYAQWAISTMAERVESRVRYWNSIVHPDQF